jgi:UDP-2,3-diacylglucosamine hydrolase
MKGIYIVSDAHFGSNEGEVSHRERVSLFFEFLELVKRKGEKLILLGDIFDFWFEYKRVVPKNYFEILKKISEISEEMEVHFVCGNHDLWADGFLESLGIRIYRESLEFTLWGRRLFLAHGDRLRRTDLGGRTVRLIMGNPVSVALYRLVHPDWGISFARLVSNLSRVKSGQKVLKNPVPAPAIDLFKEGYDVVVLGHTHYPYLDKVEKGIFMSTGDWIYHFTYGLLEDGSINLVYFRDDKRISLPLV